MNPGPLDLAAIAHLTLAHYDRRADDFWTGTRDHDVSQNIAALLNHIQGTPPFTILDFGCGPGRDLSAFTILGHIAIGLEGSARFAAMAREQGFDILQQNFLELDLPSGKFDGVFANASLFHVPSQELPRVLRELHATLKPEGVLFSSNPRGNNQEGWNGGRYGAYHDLETWRSYLLGAGFTELTHYYRPDGLPRDQQPWLASVWRKTGGKAVTDQNLYKLIKAELFTAVIGDVLDKLGYQHQFLAPGIMPLDKQMRVVGRAMPVLETDIVSADSDTPGGTAKPFGLLFEALDDLRPDEIYIATGSSLRYALWGGLMSTRAMHLKAAGAILDGFIRDATEIERLGFNVFCRGVYAQDQGPRGRVVDFRTPIEIEGIRIEPGDLLFGDREGVLVIPRAVEQEAVNLALEKVRAENKVAEAIRAGMSSCDAFQKFGVM